jgi:hypothetical protein
MPYSVHSGGCREIFPDQQRGTRILNEELIHQPRQLADHIRRVLTKESLRNHYFAPEALDADASSAVLFLVEPGRSALSGNQEPCLVLNKRSDRVRQPGDLCCPGGGISSRLDSFLEKLLRLPGSPLQRWPGWNSWRHGNQRQAKRMSMLLATSLRESYEEMRLNPLRTDFLGPLPSQHLVSFHRVIYPLVCWNRGQKQFRPNWEVERIVKIPLRSLLDPDNYARYRLTFQVDDNPTGQVNTMDHLCFVHREGEEDEWLWGATFRITMVFMQIVFGFQPPDMAGLPVVERTLDETYLTGKTASSIIRESGKTPDGGGNI